MQYSEPKNWTNLNDLRGLLFFVQRVEELTFPYTLDSFKSYTTSIRGLVAEAIESLEGAAFYPAQSKHADHILDELRSRVSGNPVVSSLLHRNIETYTNIDAANPRESIVGLQTLQAELGRGPFIAGVIEQVTDLSSDPRAKKKLDLLAKEFVATIQNGGVSREHIYRTTRETFFAGERITSSKILFKYAQELYPHNHRYTVYCLVNLGFPNLGEEVLEAFGIEANPDLESGINKHFHGRFLKKLASGNFICVSVETAAMDYYSAVSNAREQISVISNLYQLFHHKWSYEVDDTSVVEQRCCSGIPRQINNLNNSMHFVKDSTPAAGLQRLGDALDKVTFISGPDRSRYLNLISMHGLSNSSAKPESQLINLWSCMETMVPKKISAKDVSNISHVISSIIPILGLTYFRRLSVYLLRDLTRWNSKELSKTFKLYGNEENIDADQRLIRLITDQSNQSAVKHLLSELGDFELLRFRVFQMSELFGSPSNLRGRLERHEQNVRWQIHRIYRARNSIVHDGSSPNSVKYLVENAHEYYDRCFEFCLDISSTMGGFDTFDKCFKFSKDQYDHYKTMLGGNANTDDVAWRIKAQRGKSYLFDSGS